MHRRTRSLERGPHVRHVLAVELVLERERVGRDHHRFTPLDRVERGRDQVGDALSGSRPSFHEQLTITRQRPGDRLAHRFLLGAVLVALDALGERSVLGEHRRDPRSVDGPRRARTS
jgi:hypothetical protein